MTNQLTSLLSLLSLPSRQPDTPISQELDLYRRRIQRLPRKTQQIFLLSRLDHVAYTDIAHLLAVGIDSVERSMVRVFERCIDPATDADPADADKLQALRWYVHLQSPLATASQRIEFRHWLDADAGHLSAFQDSERLWRRLEAPARMLGASGWHRRKRRPYIGWLLLTALLCSLLVTAEAFT